MDFGPWGSRSKFKTAVAGLALMAGLVVLHGSWEARAETTAPRLGHVAVAVRNVDTAMAWYRDTLGFQRVNVVTIDADASPQGVVARHLFGPGVKVLRIGQMKAGNQIGLELFEFVKPVARPRTGGNEPQLGLLHLAIVVPDVETVVQKVVQNSGKVIVSGAPHAKRRVVFCQDPDGNVIEIASAPWD